MANIVRGETECYIGIEAECFILRINDLLFGAWFKLRKKSSREGKCPPFCRSKCLELVALWIVIVDTAKRKE